VKLTTYLHLVPRSRIGEAIPPLPNTPSWRCAELQKKAQGQLLLYLYTYLVSLILICDYNKKRRLTKQVHCLNFSPPKPDKKIRVHVGHTIAGVDNI